MTATHARRLRILAWVAAWAAAAALLAVAAHGVDWPSTGAAIRGTSIRWLAVAVAANLGILLLWASLWRAVLPRSFSVPYRCMLEIASLTSAVMNTVPALVGHMSAIALLVRRGGLPLRVAGSVMVLDQVGEGVTKLAVLAVALAVIGLPDWMRGGAIPVVIVVAALIAAVAMFGGAAGRQLADSRLADTGIGRLLVAVRIDLHAVRSPARATGALLIALGMKAAEAGAIACVIHAMRLDVPPGGAFVVLGAVNLATMLPVAPGNLGTYEAGAVAAFRWMGVPPETALAAALVQHLCFLLPATGAGALWLLAAGVRPAPRRIAISDGAIPG